MRMPMTGFESEIHLHNPLLHFDTLVAHVLTVIYSLSYRHEGSFISVHVLKVGCHMNMGQYLEHLS